MARLIGAITLLIVVVFGLLMLYRLVSFYLWRSRSQEEYRRKQDEAMMDKWK